MLPRERLGHGELLRLLEADQLRNHRAGRSHAKLRAALRGIPRHPALNCRCNTSCVAEVPIPERRVNLDNDRFPFGDLPIVERQKWTSIFAFRSFWRMSSNHGRPACVECATLRGPAQKSNTDAGL